MGLSSVPTLDVLPAGLDARLSAIEAFQATLPVRDFMDQARDSLSCNGVRTVDYNTLACGWTSRILVIGAGNDPTMAASGTFNIDQPPAGTVVPRVGATGATSVTATAAGVPLGAFESLYYILPLGTTYQSVPGNFRVVGYDAPFTVPYTWIRIAMRQSDGTVASIQWFDGMNQTPWVTPALGSGWAHYGVPYGPSSYRKLNGRVEMQGLMSGGSINVAAFTLPVGFRPSVDLCVASMANDGVGQVRVTAAGAVNPWTPSVAGGWVSISTVNFSASQ